MSGISSSTRLVQSAASVPGGVCARVGDDGSVQWLLKRNCSLAPASLIGVCLVLSVVSLGIGGLFWWHGALLVLPFAGLEVLALGTALLVYARHAADRECIRLHDGRLIIERSCGSRTEREEFRPDGVRVVVAPVGDTLIELAGQGRRIEIGRFVRPESRRALADELRSTLHRAAVLERHGTTGWIGSGN